MYWCVKATPAVYLHHPRERLYYLRHLLAVYPRNPRERLYYLRHLLAVYSRNPRERLLIPIRFLRKKTDFIGILQKFHLPSSIWSAKLSKLQATKRFL